MTDTLDYQQIALRVEVVEAKLRFMRLTAGSLVFVLAVFLITGFSSNGSKFDKLSVKADRTEFEMRRLETQVGLVRVSVPDEHGLSVPFVSRNPEDSGQIKVTVLVNKDALPVKFEERRTAFNVKSTIVKSFVTLGFKVSDSDLVIDFISSGRDSKLEAEYRNGELTFH